MKTYNQATSVCITFANESDRAEVVDCILAHITDGNLIIPVPLLQNENVLVIEEYCLQGSDDYIALDRYTMRDFLDTFGVEYTITSEEYDLNKQVIWATN